MRKTYAYNSIIIGFLIGLAVGASTNAALGVFVGIAVSVVGFVIIRSIENAIGKGIHKAADSISNAYQTRKEKKAAENGADVRRQSAYQTTQFPTREQAHKMMRDINSDAAAESGVSAAAGACYCQYCGRSVSAVSRFCAYCGGAL